ncbi:lipid-transfer protein [Cupriavidus sp. GA3-3]|nr:lipid-transfer protein [Cupriavidus sp. GA3-3]
MTAGMVARQAVESGAVECALALGFEFMQPGPLKSAWTDREAAMVEFTNIAAPMVQDAVEAGVPARADAVRRRRPRAHAALRHQAGDLRQDPRQGQPPRCQQPAGRVPHRRHGSRRDGREGDVARRDDPLDGLPADLRRRRCHCLHRSLREQAQPAHRRAHPGPVADHRRGPELRAAFDDRPGGLPYGRGGRAGRVRAGRRRPVGYPGLRTARLLRAERAAEL